MGIKMLVLDVAEGEWELGVHVEPLQSDVQQEAKMVAKNLH